MYFRLICRDKLTFAIIDKIATMSENADDCLAEDVIMQRQFRRSGFPPHCITPHQLQPPPPHRRPSNNPINITCTLLPCHTATYMVVI